jgi:hypothetical protein
MLDIRHSLRACDPSRAVDQCLRLNRAFSALHYVHKNGGDSMGPLADAVQSAEFLFDTGAFPAFMLALVANEIPIEDGAVLSGWGQTARKAQASDSILEWLSIAERVVSMEFHNAQKLVNDSSANTDRRVLACILVCSTNGLSPLCSFCAQLGVFQWMQSQIFKEELAQNLLAIVEKDWTRHSNNPAALISPRLTVPQLSAALASDTPALKKVTRVLLAARHAVSVNLPDSILKTLKEYSAD